MSSPDSVPGWAGDAVWYQVFLSRFHNGDTANDPPDVLPWTHDWLAPVNGAVPGRTDLFFRRYGGDLAGLREKLDYIRGLGVNTLYLNPIFAAASEHKYDATDLRHVDDTFGVAGAMSRIRDESVDPATWQWTDSDRLFLDFLQTAHSKGFRVVLDGVFNHVGQEFWAWRDVKQNGQASPYASWFTVTDFGPPLQWTAWDGPNGRLVEFARTNEGLHPEVEAHLFAVVRRWMDPNGDGDPSDGIDGWRIDAPQHVPHGFWRRFRTVVKQANPHALILGELWFDDLSLWLAGDQFDVATDYRLAHAITSFCRRAPVRPATQFAAEVEGLFARFEPARTHAMVSLLGSHDSDRLASMMMNSRGRYDAETAHGEGDPPYDGTKPNEEAYARARLAVALQFTLPGSPMIYNGDEVGMFGGDDPFCRAPMWWQASGRPTHDGFRQDMLALHQSCAKLRQECQSLRLGGLRVILADDSRRILAFERSTESDRTVVVVNGGPAPARTRVVAGRPRDRIIKAVIGEDLCDFLGGHASSSTLGAGGELLLDLPAFSAVMIRPGSRP